MFDGKVFIVKDLGNQGEVLSEIDLGSACLAAPAAAHGRVFVQSKKKLYCFGKDLPAPAFVTNRIEELKHFSQDALSSDAVSLQVVPFLNSALRLVRLKKFEVYALDARGKRIERFNNEGAESKKLTWEKWIPPTAKVKSEVDASLNKQGILTAELNAELSAGAIRVTDGNLFGITRGRVLPELPYSEDFEQGFSLSNKSSDAISFSYAPLSWLGARMRWQIQDFDGNMVAGNTLDRVLFQRAINFIGHKDLSNYTAQAEVMIDGDR